jgi:hypothetical protein
MLEQTVFATPSINEKRCEIIICVILEKEVVHGITHKYRLNSEPVIQMNNLMRRMYI